MWNNISFKSCPDIFFQYCFDGDVFMVKCELYSPPLSGGVVYVHSGDTRCELGSLKNDRGLLILDRTYPASFLTSNGIECENINSFSIETSDFGTITSYPLCSYGSTLDDAKKLLEHTKSATDAGSKSIAVNEACDRLQKLKSLIPPFLPEFRWYRVDDINEWLSLSAIRHITGNEFFAQSFCRAGFYLVGLKKDDSLFAIGIKGDPHLPNPMENALDCATCYETDSGRYYVVGIGLFDDGQYFVRL